MEVIWDGGITPEKMVESLVDNYIAAIRQGLLAIARYRAPLITEWMQTNRPWTDRTDQARLGLDTTVEDVEQALIELVLAHGVHHGWYLEGIDPATMSDMANRGSWDILLPALDHWGPIIMADIEKMVR